MADFIKITATSYRGPSTDTKPTGVPNGTTCKETDTQAVYVTNDLGETWVLVDRRVRLVEEDGTYIDLPALVATIVTANEAVETAVAALGYEFTPDLTSQFGFYKKCLTISEGITVPFCREILAVFDGTTGTYGRRIDAMTSSGIMEAETTILGVEIDA